MRVTADLYRRVEQGALARGKTFTDIVNLALDRGLRGGGNLPDPFPLEGLELNEYHWRDGLTFKRLPDGSVRVRKADYWLELVIPAAEWDSIVRYLNGG